MSFLSDLLAGKFDFIIPVSFMIFGVFVATIVFIGRYTLYRKRKRYFASLQSQAKGSDTFKGEV